MKIPCLAQSKKKRVLREFRISHAADVGVPEMPSIEQDLAMWSRLQAAEALMLLGLKQGHGCDPDRAVEVLV